MRKIDNRQYKLTHTRPTPAFNKAKMEPTGGTRRSTSTYAKATADTLFASIHRQNPWLSAKAGKKGRRYDSKLDRRGRK